jgi:hypothetical protein
MAGARRAFDGPAGGRSVGLTASWLWVLPGLGRAVPAPIAFVRRATCWFCAGRPARRRQMSLSHGRMPLDSPLSGSLCYR